MSEVVRRMLTILSFLVFQLVGSTELSDLMSPDPTLAYSWDRGYPQACHCIETGVTNAECVVFKCDCTCDLTAGSCDYNCCCDPDCSQAQVEHFENDNDFCEVSGSGPASENLCYSTSELQKVNPRSPVGGSSTTANAVDDLLCVTKVNREYKGDFYDAPTWRGSSVFSTAEGQKSFDYSDDILTVNADMSYDKNDTIPIFYNSSEGDTILMDGYFALPVADFSGYCNDNNHARFQVSEYDQVCRRKVIVDKGNEVFSQICKNELSSMLYTSLLVAANPTDNLLSLSTVPVSVTSVMYASDNITNPLLDVTESWLDGGCATSYGNNVSRSATCQFSNEVFEHTDFFCFGAVKSVSFTIWHDQTATSQILNVSLELIVVDIPFSTASTDLAQSYSISYANSPNTDAISADIGNQVTRYRSGNPGYKLGLPLVFGPIQSNVVNMSDQGLLVPSSVQVSTDQGTHDCLTGDNIVKSGLKFGHDIYSGCTARFNRSALRNFCEEGTKPAFLSVTEGYIGYFGNADPLDISQWFHLSAPPSGAIWQWNDITSICSSMTTGVMYKFLVGNTGEKANPQHKIISATVEYTTQDFKTRIPASDEESEQTVVFSVSTTFVFKDNQELKGYTPPPPPGLLTVPYDVFYPFVGNDASGHRSLLDSRLVVGFTLMLIMVYFTD